MRYLTRNFAVGAIRRGALVGQFLGGYADGEQRGLRVLTVQPDEQAYCLYVHDIMDIGDSDFCDLAEFPPWAQPAESDESGEATVCSAAPDVLLSFAEEQLGADPGRWVNGSMLDEEYADYVRAGRAPTLDPPPAPTR
jgi:hypothetical protein